MFLMFCGTFFLPGGPKYHVGLDAIKQTRITSKAKDNQPSQTSVWGKIKENEVQVPPGNYSTQSTITTEMPEI